MARIVDVAEKVAIGPFGSSIKVETFVPEGIPVISGQHLRGTRVVDNGHNFITFEHADKLKNANVYRGDVIFTHAGNIGQAAYIPTTSKYERYIISQRQFYMRCDQSKVIPEFVAYYFATHEGQHKLLANSSSVGVPSIAQPVSYLRSIEIPIPPLPEQRAIASVLGALDDKIELNRRMNETLEALAQTLFKSWFVDATANGLPKGWIEISLDEATEIITKGTTPTQDDVAGAPLSDAQINFLRVNAIADDGSILDDKLTKIPASVHGGVLKRSILKAGDVVYTIAGTIGRISVIENELLPANCNQAVAIIRPKQGVPSGFLSMWLKQPSFQEELHSNVVHAVQANLSLGMISKARIVSPPLTILRDVFHPIENILKKVRANRNESRTLATLRDALLPKLLSGELRVPVSLAIQEAEK